MEDLRNSILDALYDEYARLSALADRTSHNTRTSYIDKADGVLSAILIVDRLIPGKDGEAMGDWCTCFVTPEHTWFYYGSAVEPGSQMEPNPECPEHFPLTNKEVVES